MKKIGTLALVALTAISAATLVTGCEKKAETKAPAKAPASGGEKAPAPAGGGEKPK